MSQDIRKCGRAELDEMNRQIAIYKASGNLSPIGDSPKNVDTNSSPDFKPSTQAEQLELL
jgi:hypothetical protein